MRKLISITVGAVLAVAAGAAFSHGGGLDRNGCHHDTSTDTYHCHR